MFFYRGSCWAVLIHCTANHPCVNISIITIQTPPGYETMYDVCKSKIGEEFTNLLVDPFARGVFAADIKKLSLKAAFPAVWNKLKSRKVKTV